jgi:hypothetical protein
MMSFSSYVSDNAFNILWCLCSCFLTCFPTYDVSRNKSKSISNYKYIQHCHYKSYNEI